MEDRKSNDDYQEKTEIPKIEENKYKDDVDSDDNLEKTVFANVSNKLDESYMSVSDAVVHFERDTPEIWIDEASMILSKSMVKQELGDLMVPKGKFSYSKNSKIKNKLTIKNVELQNHVENCPCWICVSCREKEESMAKYTKQQESANKKLRLKSKNRVIWKLKDWEWINKREKLTEQIPDDGND
jgi:hypothetical protein